MEKVDKYTLRLLEYIDKLNFVDILGIGNILGVEEQEDFEEYITEILYAYANRNRKTKKQLLKLVKDVAGANRDIISHEESLNEES